MVFLSTHIDIAASPEKVRDVVCIFLFQKTNPDIDLTQFILHPFQLPRPPSSSSLFSSLIPSHPTHQSIHQSLNSNSSSSSTFPISPPGQSPKVPINLLELARLKSQKQAQAQKEKLQAILSNPVMS